jgi:predicted Zn-dependent peptidase
MEFLKHTLPNGLQVVAECNDEAHSTALGFFVQTGSRDESEDVAGVSHFLEHMVFKGTPSRSPDDVNREFDEMGAHYNAFTSEENTVYYAAVLPEYQSRTVALLADIMRPSLREEDFTTEKKVIIEEIRMYADQPPFGADDRVKAAHFGKHPLSKSVLGTVASIEALPVHKMRGYFEQRYSPGNMALVGTGRIDFEDLVKTAERLCGSWQRFEASRETPRATGHAGFECVVKDSAAMEYVMQLTNGPGAQDDDRFAAKLLATIVGDDSGSRLFWELVDPGLAENASLGHYDFQGTGLFMTSMSCEPAGAAENMAIIRRLYEVLQAEGVTAAELSQAKSKINSRVVLGSEKPRGRLFNVGSNWINRNEYRSVADDLASVDAVTVEEISAVLKKYPLTESTGIAIGPLADLG